MGLLDILKHYADPSAASPANVENHFDEVAANVPAPDLGSGVAAAFRSDATPPFASMVGSLFAHSDPQQRAGLLNQLLPALGGGAFNSVAGGLLGHLLGTSAGAPPSAITPDQAAQLTPDAVTQIASHAERQDGGIVDRVGAFYAQHPTLVKTLGAAALSVAMGHLGKRR